MERTSGTMNATHWKKVDVGKLNLFKVHVDAMLSGLKG